MSNDLAIATVTATLKRILEAAVIGHVQSTSMTVTVGQPDSKDAIEVDKGKVNIFLYQATANPGWRNADLPTRRPNGTLSQRPQLALDLHYLISFYGDRSKFVPERLMGIVMKRLHVQPFLTRKMIDDTVNDQSYDFLKLSNLAKQPELIKFSPVSLSLEELSKIWSIFFQTQYVLSTAYQGTVVLIEPDDDLAPSLPVTDRRISVAATPPPVPIPQPVITQIRSEAGANELITPESMLLIQGQALTQGAIDFIQLDDQQVPSTEANIRNTEIILQLPATEAGVKTLQIVYQNNLRSNLAKFIVHSAEGGTS